MFYPKAQMIIIIEGMNCEHCATKVKEALIKLEGIIKVKVDVKQKKVNVFLKHHIESKVIENVITSIGYKVIRIDNV